MMRERNKKVDACDMCEFTMSIGGRRGVSLYHFDSCCTYSLQAERSLARSLPAESGLPPPPPPPPQQQHSSICPHFVSEIGSMPESPGPPDGNVQNLKRSRHVASSSSSLPSSSSLTLVLSRRVAGFVLDSCQHVSACFGYECAWTCGHVCDSVVRFRISAACRI